MNFFHPRDARRALKLIWASSPRWTIANAVIVLLQSVLPLLSLYLLKLIIDAIEIAVTAGASDDLDQILTLIVLAGVIALIGLGLQSLSNYVAEAQALEVTDYVQGLLHEKSIDVDLTFFENPAYHDTLHRAQREGVSRPTQIVNSITTVSRSGLSLLLILGLLFSFYWWLTVILFLAALPGLWLRLRYTSKLYDLQERRTMHERQASYFNWLVTSEKNARELRIFDAGPFFIGRYRQLRQRLRAEKLDLSAWFARYEFISQASNVIVIFAAFAFMAYQTVRGVISLGDLVVFYQAFQQAQGYLQGLMQGLNQFNENNLFLANVFDFLDLQADLARPPAPRPLPAHMQAGVRFEGVSFKYPGTERFVLQDIDLEIRPDQVIALVGENGSGKTTLIKLLCRFYDPTQGRILLDGIDLREYDLPGLRRKISVIFQDYVWYHLLTAQDNIWLGDVHDPPDLARIRAAADAGGAHDFIAILPDGYDSIMGRLFDSGQDISVGQWQRLALARAFYRPSEIIILDEPSSALDPKAEAEVFARFRALTAKRTAVLISHRLSNVKSADCIHVLENGRLVESGSHAALMAQGGSYRHLFEAQAQHYR